MGDQYIDTFEMRRTLKTWGTILFVFVVAAHLIKRLAPVWAPPQSYEFAVMGIPGRVLDSLDDARVGVGSLFSRLSLICPGNLEPYCETANQYTRMALGID